MPVDISTLTEQRIAYLEGLVAQARTAASVFTQYTQEDVDRIVKAMVVAGMSGASQSKKPGSAFSKTRPSKTWWRPSLCTTTSATNARWG